MRTNVFVCALIIAASVMCRRGDAGSGVVCYNGCTGPVVDNFCWDSQGQPIGLAYTDESGVPVYLDITGGSATQCPTSGNLPCYDGSGNLIGYSYTDASSNLVYVDMTGGGSTSCAWDNSYTYDANGNIAGYFFTNPTTGGNGYFDLAGSDAAFCQGQ